jgi:hypothetical protein
MCNLHTKFYIQLWVRYIMWFEGDLVNNGCASRGAFWDWARMWHFDILNKELYFLHNSCLWHHSKRSGKGKKALHHDYSCELPLFWTTHSKWFKCLGDWILCSNMKKTIVWWHCLTHLPFTQCSIYSHEFSLDLILTYRGMIFFPLTRHQYICYIGMASLQYVSSLFKCNRLMFLNAQNFETHCYLFKVNWDASWPPNSYMCVVIMFIHIILILQLMPWPGVRGSKFQINWCN